MYLKSKFLNNILLSFADISNISSEIPNSYFCGLTENSKSSVCPCVASVKFLLWNVLVSYKAV